MGEALNRGRLTEGEKEEFLAALRSGCESFGVDLSDDLVGEMLGFWELVSEWNTRMNLTSIEAPEEAAIKHFVDSLLCELPLSSLGFGREAGARIIDIGTGAGFPGIPLKLAGRRREVVLLESIAKKCDFLRAAVRELGLTEVTVANGRAEELGREAGFRDGFDIAVSRGLARLNVAVELCSPFVRRGGWFIAMKGAEGDEEVREARYAVGELRLEVRDVMRLNLPKGFGERALIVFEKTDHTPEKYPRRVGMPNKRPLLGKG